MNLTPWQCITARSAVSVVFAATVGCFIGASSAIADNLDLPTTNDVNEFLRRASPSQIENSFIGLLAVVVGPMGTMYDALRTMDRKPAIALSHTFHNEDGASRTVKITTFSDLETFITAERKIHAMHVQEIRRRGYESLGSMYKVAASAECPKTYLESGDAAVQKNEFLFRLTQDNKRYSGVVVESSVALMSERGFDAPPLVGKIDHGRIALEHAISGCQITLTPQ